jgi:hypothetical protein
LVATTRALAAAVDAELKKYAVDTAFHCYSSLTLLKRWKTALSIDFITPLRGSVTSALYSITTNQAAIAALFRVMNRYVGNLPPMSGVFPDYPAPVVRNAGGEREMVLMR